MQIQIIQVPHDWGYKDIRLGLAPGHLKNYLYFITFYNFLITFWGDPQPWTIHLSFSEIFSTANLFAIVRRRSRGACQLPEWAKASFE